jgi:outer membrane lipoprotein-sorting protein
MLNRTSLAALVLAAALIPCLSMAAQTAALPPLSAAQIVDKNVAARGGLAAWRAVQTMSWKGRMGAGASTYSTVSPAGKLQTKTRDEAQLPFALDYKRPLKTRLEIQFNGQTAVQVFDGSQGWKLRPFLGRNDWEPYTADELKQAAAEPGIDGLLIDYAAKGSRVESAGTDTVEGHAAYKLKVTPKRGLARSVWVDGQSFLDLKMGGEPRRLDGRPHAVEVYLREFKAERGLMIPHVLETAVQGVKRTEKIVIESVTINPTLDDARFSKPQ